FPLGVEEIDPCVRLVENHERQPEIAVGMVVAGMHHPVCDMLCLGRCALRFEAGQLGGPCRACWKRQEAGGQKAEAGSRNCPHVIHLELSGLARRMRGPEYMVFEKIGTVCALAHAMIRHGKSETGPGARTAVRRAAV